MTRTRRSFLGLLGSAGIALSVTGFCRHRIAFADNADTDYVDPMNARAATLGYSVESKQSEQTCEGCQLYQEDARTQESAIRIGSCALFPGKLVPAQAWCSSWMAKTI